MIHGDSLKNTPDGGKLRLPDAQSKPWQALGISRATWYRQGKPRGHNQLYYWRQKNRAESSDSSVRSIQRLAFARRYGIPEIERLAIQKHLSPAMLEEIAKWEHEYQRRFTDRLFALAADLPKQFEPDDYFRSNFSAFEVVVLPVKESKLRRAARSAFDATIREMVAEAMAELSAEISASAGGQARCDE